MAWRARSTIFNRYFILFLIVQITLIGLILYRESIYIATVAQLHNTEQQLAKLTTQRQQLLYELSQKQSRTALAAEAQQRGFAPLSLDQIHTLP